MASVQTPTSDSHPKNAPSHDRGQQGFNVPGSQGGKGWSELTKPLMAFIGVVLVIAAVVAAVMSHRNQKAAAGRDAMYNARKALEGEMKAMAKAEIPAGALDAKPEAAAKGAAKKTPEQEQAEKAAREERAMGEALDKIAYRKFDVDTKLPEGVKKLKAVSEEFKGTRAGFEANLALGNLYTDHGDAAKAAPWFEKAADDAPSGFERSLAYAAIGYAHETQGQAKEALENFERGLKSAEGNVKADLLLAVARSEQRLSNPAKAKQTYDQVISQFPGSEYAKTAEQQKALLD